MIFESPAILWALPLALLPTLIHLMGKRPRKPTPIPSLMWLNTFKTSERRRQKVRDLIVLALRTLIILSIILGLSRPSFETTTQELVIDNHPGLWNQG
ncbi:MAG: BatA domain-containing protein, partial [Schleiferiaceae bacterium]|nr:BatA domain-containing protein [Schleiferiaceae bacterium]